MITISIWLYILSLMGATSLGVILMCAFNVASVNDRAMAAACRALDASTSSRPDGTSCGPPRAQGRTGSAALDARRGAALGDPGQDGDGGGTCAV